VASFQQGGHIIHEAGQFHRALQTQFRDPLPQRLVASGTGDHERGLRKADPDLRQGFHRLHLSLAGMDQTHLHETERGKLRPSFHHHLPKLLIPRPRKHAVGHHFNAGVGLHVAKHIVLHRLGDGHHASGSPERPAIGVPSGIKVQSVVQFR